MNKEVYYFDTKQFLENMLVKVAVISSTTLYGTLIGYDKETKEHVTIRPTEVFDNKKDAIDYAHNHFKNQIEEANKQIDYWKKKIKEFEDYISEVKKQDEKIL